MLKIFNLSYGIPEKGIFNKDKSPKVILSDINLEIGRGEIVGIAGESGSGKTTLAKIIAGFIRDYKGDMNFNLNPDRRSSPVQLLFQNNESILNPFRTVRDVIIEAVQKSESDTADPQKKMEEIFEILKVDPEIYDRKCCELSGGERIRVALARILAVEPEMLILDEPFAAQDVVSQANLIELLGRLNKEMDLTMIIISHNLKALRSIAQRLLIMFNGRIIESGETGSVINDPRSDYTKFLIQSEDYNINYEDFVRGFKKFSDK